MREKRGFSLPAVGAGSLIGAFAVLTLTVFALMSLVTAQAELRLAESIHRTVSDYYAADLRAEEIFARLRQGQEMPEVYREDNFYSYSCPISESQILLVELERRDGQWQVLRWQAAAVLPEEMESGQNLWKGNREERP